MAPADRRRRSKSRSRTPNHQSEDTYERPQTRSSSVPPHLLVALDNTPKRLRRPQQQQQHGHTGVSPEHEPEDEAVLLDETYHAAGGLQNRGGVNSFNFCVCCGLVFCAILLAWIAWVIPSPPHSNPTSQQSERQPVKPGLKVPSLSQMWHV